MSMSLSLRRLLPLLGALALLTPGLAFAQQMAPDAVGPNGVLWPRYNGNLANVCGQADAVAQLYVCTYRDGTLGYWHMSADDWTLVRYFDPAGKTYHDAIPPETPYTPIPDEFCGTWHNPTQQLVISCDLPATRLPINPKDGWLDDSNAHVDDASGSHETLWVEHDDDQVYATVVFDSSKTGPRRGTVSVLTVQPGPILTFNGGGAAGSTAIVYCNDQTDTSIEDVAPPFYCLNH